MASDSARLPGRLPVVGWPARWLARTSTSRRRGCSTGSRAPSARSAWRCCASWRPTARPLEDLRRNVETGRLVFQLADRVIGGPRNFTAEEVAERSGISLDFLLASRRAMGLPIPEPGEAAFTEKRPRGGPAQRRGDGGGDLRGGPAGAAAGARPGPRPGRRDDAGSCPLKLVLRAGISELELAQHYGETVAQLYPMVDPLMSNILALHLRHATETEIVGAAERDGGRLPGSRRVAIGVRGPGRLHQAGRGSPAGRARPPGHPPGSDRARGGRRRRCAWSRRSATPRCSPRRSPSRCWRRRWA